MKVLLAEDDAFYCRILQSVLRDDYQVVIAEDGNRAWEMLQAGDAPRLALLDWQMPGLDGLEVCRRVRARPAMDTFYLVIATVRQSLRSPWVKRCNVSPHGRSLPYFLADNRKGTSRTRRCLWPAKDEFESSRASQSMETSKTPAGKWNSWSFFQKHESDSQHGQEFPWRHSRSARARSEWRLGRCRFHRRRIFEIARQDWR